MIFVRNKIEFLNKQKIDFGMHFYTFEHLKRRLGISKIQEFVALPTVKSTD